MEIQYSWEVKVLTIVMLILGKVKYQVSKLMVKIFCGQNNRHPSKVVDSCFGNGTKWISRNPHLALVSENRFVHSRNNCSLLL